MKNVNPILKRKIHIFGLIISSKKGKLTVISHGFHKEIMVEDFPLRGKVVYRNWNLIAQGTRMTVEFAVFLKVLDQYQS
ncbi:hypothetical protein V3A08_13800 [Tenacibaculum maritimum]|uniref:hypothetical protein n=1 Tax=Tenacibaculum maritimum TaxID=107401 RepID=UPI001F37EFF8|nr:hypothetical protein [Tenacibaculum maritimum]MDB0602707.1 hypothetical protein [Tenacibaculum maritimum]MDB0612310.1 hypothetical protein [Tenacibaculum maritimum]